MNKIALITGASGMDAKTLTHFLLKKDYHVILTHRVNSSLDLDSINKLFIKDLEDNPSAKLSFCPCDITDHNSIDQTINGIIIKHGKIDELYLLAAMSHVGNSYLQPEFSIAANGQSVFCFLETLRKVSIKTKVFLAATSELVNNPNSAIILNESTPWKPVNPYAIGKALGAFWVNYFRTAYGMFACYAIFSSHSNIYRSKDFVIRKITNTAARIALDMTNKIKLSHLDWKRDEFFADFGVEAAWKMLQLNVPTDLVLGNGETRTGEEYVGLAFNYFGLNWENHMVFDSSFKRPNQSKEVITDPSLAVEKIGWIKNRISFKRHIEIMCKFDYELESGLEPVRCDIFKI